MHATHHVASRVPLVGDVGGGRGRDKTGAKLYKSEQKNAAHPLALRTSMRVPHHLTWCPSAPLSLDPSPRIPHP